MNNYIKILLLVVLFSSCSILDSKTYKINDIENTYLNHNIFNTNYIGMTRKQIIFIFGMPIISDSFSDVYHYFLYNKKSDYNIQKVMLNLYFKDNKVSSVKIT